MCYLAGFASLHSFDKTHIVSYFVEGGPLGIKIVFVININTLFIKGSCFTL